MHRIRFAVFTDLHYDHIPDGDIRIREFIDRAGEEDIDFIIELGDLCYPTEENRSIPKALGELGVPCYYTLGNHDTDVFPREQVMSFLGMKNNYYSFVKGDVKFIVLDACYIKRGSEFIPYFKRNYSKTSDSYPYIPPEELSWLENELKDNNSYYVLFSHHSLVNGFAQRGAANREEVRSILEKANASGKRVLMCMNGHDHGDSVAYINGICYYTLNAMSYIWHGLKETFCYSKDIHERYPSLKYMILYEEGLNAIVTITENGQLIIEGMRSSYQYITPNDVGIINNTWNGISIKPVVSSMSI